MELDGSDARPRRRPLPAWTSGAADYLAAAAGIVIVELFHAGEPSVGMALLPSVFVAANWASGLYRRDADGQEPALSGWRIAALLLTAALFAASAVALASLPLAGQVSLAGAAGLWLTVFGSSMLTRAAARRMSRSPDLERWLLVGDARTAVRLQEALRADDIAQIVGTEPLPVNGFGSLDGRAEALSALAVLRADRVVFAPVGVGADQAFGLIRTFKALGVPVSLVEPSPHLAAGLPLAPRQVGRLPVLEVGQLSRNGHAMRNGNGRAPRVSVILPALNEEENLPYVLRRLPPGLHEVILIDGVSSDRTVDVARRERPDIRIITQTGSGKGDALRTGFAAVTGDIIVTLDADGSADPAEIPRFVDTLVAGSDFAKGSRFMGEGGSDDITPIRQLGNWALSTTANALYGTSHTDLCYGYNAFWTHCLPYISVDVPGFEVETLMTLRSAKAGLKVSEVPSFESRRMYGHSNLKTCRDGMRVLKTILRERQS